MGERQTAVRCVALALIAGTLSACAQLETSLRDALAAPNSAKPKEAPSEPKPRVLLANLRLGDLVYFDIGGKKHAHVGLYIGDGRFVHASASGRKVRMSRLDTPYWRERVSEARRLDTRPSAGR